jgi:predicted membrane protein
MPEIDLGGGGRARFYGVRVHGRLGSILFGLTVIAVGVVFTLDHFGIIAASRFLPWWPVALIAYGLARLTGLGCRTHIVAGAGFTFAGAWMLLHNLHYIRYDIWDVWPLLLILIGVSLVSSAIARGRDAARIDSAPIGSTTGADSRAEGVDTGSSLNAFAVMSGSTRKIVTNDFRGGEVIAIMAGHDIDLRAARIASGTATIDLLVWWGGVDIWVPEDWKVSCEAMPLMAGVEDHTRPPAAEVKGHLILKGLVVMGGVEVKN